ncbi:Hypothetical predicted protein [Podarcis lilfordi]|uniref:Uncharacterized protein n=1 Tax=Podarcis lilfordi TaxID=74358 RepID=A0AA35PNP5_9SAUR|nr:Hypothetical predicted protein [Podarcis lilfordi]
MAKFNIKVTNGILKGIKRKGGVWSTQTGVDHFAFQLKKDASPHPGSSFLLPEISCNLKSATVEILPSW